MIEDSIRAHALTNGELASLIGDRFHLTINHNSDDNYVVLTVISDATPVELHMEDNQSEALIQFDCYSKDPKIKKDIAAAIDNTFNKQGFEDAELRVQLAIKQNRNPDFDSDSGLFRESLDYEFLYNRKEA